MSEKTSSQNGLRMHPKLLPHQLRPISTYPNPPVSHIGNNQKIDVCCYFSLFPRAGRVYWGIGEVGAPLASLLSPEGGPIVKQRAGGGLCTGSSATLVLRSGGIVPDPTPLYYTYSPRPTGVKPTATCTDIF